MNAKLVYVIFLMWICVLANVSAFENNVEVDFFYSISCPHCEKERLYLDRLESQYEWLKINDFEISKNESNAKLYMKKASDCGKQASSVPATFICGEMIVGYGSDEFSGEKIREKILSCREKNRFQTSYENCTDLDKESTLIELPIFGVVDAANMSLPLFTIVLGGLDGFNPCAFFVLFFLLSLLIHAKSRFRMLLIGGIFVFFSGLIYFLFMAAWLNIFLFIGQLQIITTTAGLIALAVAIINIKDFFWFKKGVSLSISDKGKNNLFTKMRNLMKATELSSMIVGTVVLAIAANTYELLCTAGFPMVYTRVLTLNKLSNLDYYLYLGLYNIVYVLPLFTIVVFFTYTLGSRKLRKEEGRSLKLMSGNMMLFLGLMLVFRAELLNNLLAAVAVMIFSVAATVIASKLYKPKEKEGIDNAK